MCAFTVLLTTDVANQSLLAKRTNRAHAALQAPKQTESPHYLNFGLRGPGPAPPKSETNRVQAQVLYKCKRPLETCEYAWLANYRRIHLLSELLPNDSLTQLTFAVRTIVHCPALYTTDGGYRSWDIKLSKTVKGSAEQSGTAEKQTPANPQARKEQNNIMGLSNKQGVYSAQTNRVGNQPHSSACRSHMHPTDLTCHACKHAGPTLTLKGARDIMAAQCCIIFLFLLTVHSWGQTITPEPPNDRFLTNLCTST